jgi:hypothetical protein
VKLKTKDMITGRKKKRVIAIAAGRRNQYANGIRFNMVTFL